MARPRWMRYGWSFHPYRWGLTMVVSGWVLSVYRPWNSGRTFRVKFQANAWRKSKKEIGSYGEQQ